MVNGKPNMKWINWVDKHHDKLILRNYKEELLSRVSFKAGYKQAVIDAGKWWYEYLSEGELCKKEGDDIMLKFLKDIMGE